LISPGIAEETWREVALLAAGLRREGGEKFLDRNFGDNERLAGFLAALAARENDPALPPDVRFACAEVAVRAASDDLPDAHAIHARLTTPAANALERDATQARAALDTRLHLGAYLSRHGDPRAHVMQVDAMQFCLVPRGEFWMGEDESEFAEEQPAHRFDIPYDYWLGRYPVTNAQFDAFIQDEGYADPAWWTVARKAGAWRDGQVIRRVYRFDPNTLPPDMRTEFETLFAEERYAEAFSIIVKRKLDTLEGEAAASPGPALFHGAWLEFAERAQRFPNHPVTAVSWYEALAFCAWLEARWRTRGWLPEGWRITLPSEAEWEKAARGGERILARPVIAAPRELRDSGDGQPAQLATNPNPRRRYPWGDDFSTEACNVFETGEHFSTTVGCFAPHASPYGCQDMDGNVWEWTRSLYGRYDYDERRATCQFRYPYAEQIEVREDEAASPDITRALRGGSFDVNRRDARAACRYGLLFPSTGVTPAGFRVAARPHLSASGR
jgi:formylglycine-generating enzyme required for sulfatase activity